MEHWKSKKYMHFQPAVKEKMKKIKYGKNLRRLGKSLARISKIKTLNHSKT